MRLRVAPRARAVEQQDLACLLGHGAPEVLLDQEGGEGGGTRAAGAGDARTVHEEQPIGDHFLTGERLEKILIVIPAYAGTPALHEAAATQDEAARADADERHGGCADLAQVARGGFIDLGTGVEEAADDDDVVEQVGRQQRTRRLDQHPAAGRDCICPTGHDGPLHVHGPAAVTLVGRQTQMINEDRERRQGELVRENDTDAKRRSHTALRCSRSCRRA